MVHISWRIGECRKLHESVKESRTRMTETTVDGRTVRCFPTHQVLKTSVRAEFGNVHSLGVPVGVPHVSLGLTLVRLDTVTPPLKTLM